jgi:endonuclease/exonuclease/phosphatase family metal-dependent hydrolase
MTRKQILRLKEPSDKQGLPKSDNEASAKAQSTENTLQMRIITHNIRYATEAPFKGEERWPIRCPRLCSQLIFNSMSNPATFVCLQEVLHSQLLDILDSLNESADFNGRWDYIGVGRDDGKRAGEYAPIFYRPSIWELKKFDTVWLSETPRTPSKGWDAASTRIVTVGQFVHRNTKQRVMIMSTHLDDQGVKSRQESVKIILKVIQFETELDAHDVILVAGDFNSPTDGDAYQLMTSPSYPYMEDVGLKVPKERRYGNKMTFSSFGYVDASPSRIDFIFARKGDRLNYGTYGVLANQFDDGVYLSDHRACVADLQHSLH